MEEAGMAWVEFAENIQTGQKSFFRRHIVTEQEYSQIEQAHRERKQITDIYHSIFKYSCADPNDTSLQIYGPLYLDFDVQDIETQYPMLVKQVKHAIAKLYSDFQIPVEFFQIYFSGNKGFHIILDPIIFNLQYMDPIVLTNTYRRIVEDIPSRKETSCLDTQIYDKRRVFRITNSKNSKSGLYKIPLKYDQIPETWDAMKNLAMQPKEEAIVPVEIVPQAVRKLREYIEYRKPQESKRYVRYHSIKPKMFPCTEYLLNKVTVGQGHRNIVTIALASGLFGAGYSTEEVTDMVQTWNLKNNPPLPEHEIHSTVLSARKMSANNRRYGCTTYKELDLCLPALCPLAGQEVKK